MSQVVHDYGDVCQAVTELAVELNVPITTEDFRALNGCLDDAIAGAVTEYGRERTQSGIEGGSGRGSERLGFFAHELRNLINTAIVAFEVLKTGNVGVAGSTGTVLHRSLMASRALIGRSLAEVRLTKRSESRAIPRAGFIEEIASASTLEANARAITLTALPVEDGVAIQADRQVLAAVVETFCRMHSNSPGLRPPSRSESVPAPSACTSRFRTSAAVSRAWARRRALPPVRATRRRSHRRGSWSRLQQMGAKRTVAE